MLKPKEIRELKAKTLAAAMVLIEAGQIELRGQGHRATGKLIDTMEAVVTDERPASFTVGIEIEDYGLEVDSGTPASDVPSPFKDVAEFSRHIDQVRTWSKQVLPGLDQIERSNFLLATNRRHRLEGIPTKASIRFSTNNRRTGWIKNSFEDPQTQEQAAEKLDLFLFVNLLYDRAIEEATK